MTLKQLQNGSSVLFQFCGSSEKGRLESKPKWNCSESLQASFITHVQQNATRGLGNAPYSCRYGFMRLITVLIVFTGVQSVRVSRVLVAPTWTVDRQHSFTSDWMQRSSTDSVTVFKFRQFVVVRGLFLPRDERCFDSYCAWCARRYCVDTVMQSWIRSVIYVESCVVKWANSCWADGLCWEYV